MPSRNWRRPRRWVLAAHSLIGTILLAILLFGASPPTAVHAFHQYVPRADHNDCPVRIHSNRVHGYAGASPGASLDADFGEFEGETFATNGQIIQPWPNNTGMLSSDSFQPNEFLKSKCQFIFLGAVDEHVQIIFHKFALYTAETVRQWNKTVTTLRCEEEDRVTAHVLVGSRMSKIHDFCGEELPPQLMSAKNLLTLNYALKSGNSRPSHANAADGEKKFGFLLEYRFLPDYGIQPDEAIKSSNESCSFMFNGTVKTSGDLWSPNYPGFYPRNLDCQYVFHGREGQIVFISFEYFDVEGFAQCEESTQSDFVLFSNYRTMDRTNRRYCGGTRPPRASISSESNYFRMQFRTNDIFDGTGFYAHYQFYDQQSSQTNRIKLTNSGAVDSQFKCSIILNAFLISLNILAFTFMYRTPDLYSK